MTEPGRSETKAHPVSVLGEPLWLGVFMVLAMLFSLLPFALGFVAGLSVSNTSVFGIYALLGGVLADLLLRRKFRRALVVFRAPHIPFVTLWIVLCAYVIVVRPF